MSAQTAYAPTLWHEMFATVLNDSDALSEKVRAFNDARDGDSAAKGSKSCSRYCATRTSLPDLIAMRAANPPRFDLVYGRTLQQNDE
jgi:hypothetical protein